VVDYLLNFLKNHGQKKKEKGHKEKGHKEKGKEEDQEKDKEEKEKIVFFPHLVLSA
jgi:hypothetical protein